MTQGPDREDAPGPTDAVPSPEQAPADAPSAAAESRATEPEHTPSAPGLLAAMRPQTRQALFWAGVGAALLWVLWLLSPILAPFVAGIVLAYMLNPGVEWMQRHRFNRTWASLVMISVALLAMLLLVLILVPVIAQQAELMRNQLPNVVDRVNQVLIPKLNQMLGTQIQLDAGTFRTLVMDTFDKDAATKLVNSVMSGGLAVVGWLGTLLLLPLVVFYVLDSWPNWVAKVHGLVPQRWQGQTSGIAREIDDLLAQFLRGQLSVMLALAIYYSAALAVAGFSVALPVGILTGLLVFIPYLGFALGLVLALMAALLQFGSVYGFVAVAVIYGFGQLLESFVLTPRLVGERIGLHPLVVIFALMAFGQLFGFVGVLIALPVSAVIAVALRRLYGSYRNSDFYTRSQ
ncbi:AI-2E family transporter [Piscinibacterium candidicorallinum]|uniref:AI-2E family transporter n=1 Tax=Piscinibacterium candidicorallinum TaxID=1793872 RepID=A0ABV7H0S0_9BURK